MLSCQSPSSSGLCTEFNRATSSEPFPRRLHFASFPLHVWVIVSQCATVSRGRRSPPSSRSNKAPRFLGKDWTLMRGDGQNRNCAYLLAGRGERACICSFLAVGVGRTQKCGRANCERTWKKPHRCAPYAKWAPARPPACLPANLCGVLASASKC